MKTSDKILCRVSNEHIWQVCYFVEKDEDFCTVIFPNGIKVWMDHIIEYDAEYAGTYMFLKTLPETDALDIVELCYNKFTNNIEHLTEHPNARILKLAQDCDCIAYCDNGKYLTEKGQYIRDEVSKNGAYKALEHVIHKYESINIE